MVLPLSRIMNLEVGETIALHCGPDDPVSLRCGGIPLTTGTIGRIGQNIAVKVSNGIDGSRTGPFDKDEPQIEGQEADQL